MKYISRPDIVDRRTLEQNFKNKFETLNRVRLTNSEFLRLREEIINPDVFAASKLMRERNYFQREDGTPLHYTLVNSKDWCKNDFEVAKDHKAQEIGKELGMQRIPGHSPHICGEYWRYAANKKRQATEAPAMC